MSILDLIADKRNKQADIARRYATEIKGNRPADEYGEINRAIVERWSRSGLKRIKRWPER